MHNGCLLLYPLRCQQISSPTAYEATAAAAGAADVTLPIQLYLDATAAVPADISNYITRSGNEDSRFPDISRYFVGSEYAQEFLTAFSSKNIFDLYGVHLQFL